MTTLTTGRATDFITFSRTSNATVTGADGRIRWAGHNLLTNSESFDGWTTNYGVTVTANAIAAPNGTTTADRLVEQAINDTHFIGQNDRITTPSNTLVPHTLAVFAKADQRQYLNLSIEWSTNYVAATFDLSGGTVTSNRAGGTGTGNTSTITPVGSSGWYLCTLTGILGTAGSNGAVISISNVAVPTGSKASYLGNTSNGLYLWGAHLYRSDLGGMVLNPARGDAYYPTTPRNLLGFTESLTTGWTNTNTTDSIVTETNPNGLSSSVEVTATAGNGTLLGSLSLLASPYTFSIWLKRKTGTGTVEITVDGTTYVTAAVTSSWQRFSTTLTPSAGTRTPGIRIVTSGDAVFAWGAQLSDSASLDAYSPVYGAAVTSAAYYAPRLDFDANGSALGLLVEEQRTNVLLHTAAFDNAAWTKASLITTGTPAWVDVGVAPDGTTTADALIEDTATSVEHVAYQSVTVAAGTQYTWTIYAKRYVGTRDIYMQANLSGGTTGAGFAWFNLSTGVASAVTTLSGTFTATASSVPVGNSWYRCTLTVTTNTGNTGAVLFSGVYNGARSYTGDGTSAILVWGAQFEIGASNAPAPFATSYIPNGSAVAGATRAADAASLSTQAIPYSANLSIVVNAMTSVPQAASKKYLIMGNSIPSVAMDTTTVAGELPNIATIAGLSASYSQNTPFKAGFAFSSGNSVLAFNGTVGTTSTVAATPATSSEFVFGRNYIGNIQNINGYIRQVTVIPRRLSNSELQARTV